MEIIMAWLLAFSVAGNKLIPPEGERPPVLMTNAEPPLKDDYPPNPK